MTESDTAPESDTQEVAAPGDDPTPENTPTPPGGEQSTPNSEAARYRRRLRETEAERDALRGRVEHMQRGEVERLAAARLADAADVWRDGAQIADLLDDNGNVDPTKVDTLLGGLVDTHPHWSNQQRAVRPSATMKSGASAPTPPRSNTFAQAFKPPKR